MKPGKKVIFRGPPCSVQTSYGGGFELYLDRADGKKLVVLPAGVPPEAYMAMATHAESLRPRVVDTEADTEPPPGSGDAG